MNPLIHHHNLLRKDLLLCFDAFGTLFTPKAPIAEQYGEIARRHGLSGFSDQQIKDAFGKAFKEESKERPNYGKAVGMEAPEWWGNIIKNTFQPFLNHNTSFPPGLIPDMLTRFSSKEGYELYPDVLPFFERLRKIRKQKNHSQTAWPWQRTTVGVVTNSDDRVPHILKSFGLSVGPRFHTASIPWKIDCGGDTDIDFVVLSYDVGEEKPHPDIFRAARTASQSFMNMEDEEAITMLYVGDEISKDVMGAIKAGWHAVFLDRDRAYESSERGTPARVLQGTRQLCPKTSVTVARDLNIIGGPLKAIWQESKEISPLEIQPA